MKISRKRALLMGVAALAVSSMIWLQFRSEQLSVMPKEHALSAPALPPAAESSMLVAVEFDLDEMIAKATAAAPEVVHLEDAPVVWQDNGFIARSLNGGKKLKVKAPYKVDISRGDIEIFGEGNTLVLKTTIKLKGKAGLSGAIAKAIDIDAENIDAKVGVKIVVQIIGVDPEGNLVVAVTPDVDVKSARLEIADGIFLDLSGHARQAADRAVDDLRKAIASELNSDKIKQVLAEKVWRQNVTPLGAGALVVTPTRIGLSPMTVEGRKATIALAMFARAEVVPKAPNPADWHEPVVFTPIEYGSSTFRIEMPFTLEYAAINKALNAQLPTTVDAGGARVKITNARVYPVGERLAVVLDVDADLPGLWGGDVKGQVALTAAIKVEKTDKGDVLRLRDISFARRIDNPIWSALSAAGEGVIISELERTAEISLADVSAQATVYANALLAKEGEARDFRAEVSNISIDVQAVAPAANGLQLVLEAGMNLSGQFDVASLN